MTGNKACASPSWPGERARERGVFRPSAPCRSCGDGRNTPGHDGEGTIPLILEVLQARGVVPGTLQSRHPLCLRCLMAMTGDRTGGTQRCMIAGRGNHGNKGLGMLDQTRPPIPIPLLDVRGVTLQYKSRDHLVTATYRVDFSVQRSGRFILLGPSGCSLVRPAAANRPC
jgi:hypothetical protein